MNAYEINVKALENLRKQNFAEAQKLFFMNAKEHPSHNTYNNLGYYLLTEGIICKNGKTIGAYKTGRKYIMEAYTMGKSTVNMLAAIYAFELEANATTTKRRNEIYRIMKNWIKEKEFLKSKEVLYSYLRICYLLGEYDVDEIQQIRALIQQFPNQETISLYLELLRINKFKEEGLQCIKKYGDIIDSFDRLLFEVDMEICSKDNHKEVVEEYYPERICVALIIQCLLQTGENVELLSYIESVRKNEDAKLPLKLFGFSKQSIDYRKRLISQYRNTPAFLTTCCYLGCKEHDTPWE